MIGKAPVTTAAWVALELLLSAALLSGAFGALMVALDAPPPAVAPVACPPGQITATLPPDTIECWRWAIRVMSGPMFPAAARGDTDPPPILPDPPPAPASQAEELERMRRLIRGMSGPMFTTCFPPTVFTRRYGIEDGKLVDLWGCYPRVET